MKKAFYLSLSACLLIATAQAQTPRGKKFEVYQGKPGITKKLSELQAEVSSQSTMPKPPSKEKKEFDMKEIKKFDESIENKKPVQEGLREESAPDNSGAAEVPGETSTQKIWSNFLATTFEEYPQFIPPDPTGAVGPTQVAVVTNDMVKVFEKRTVTDAPLTSYKGTLHTPAPSQVAIPLYDFFRPVLTDGFPGDVHVRFDRTSRRWFISGVEFFQSAPSNNILLAVSDGEHITNETSFTFYQIPSDLIPHNKKSGAPLFDNPRLGVDANAVLIGASNYFTHTDSCGFLYYDSLYSVGLALNKKSLLCGSLVGYALKIGAWQFNEHNTGFGLILPRGVYNDNPTAPKSFFAGINLTGTEPNAGDGIVLAGLTFDKNGTLTDVTETTLPVGPFQYPRNVTALGSPRPIDPSDTRLVDAVIYKNKLTGKSALWTSHAIGVNQAGDLVSFENFYLQGRTAARWYEIGDVYSKPKISQSGTVYDSVQESGRRAISYFNPSIAANGQGTVVMCGTTTAYNRYLNVFIVGRYFKDTHGTLNEPQKVTATSGMYDLTSRWGDYSQSVVDPIDNQTIWSFQDYAASDDNFGVRAVQVKAPPPATPLPLADISNKDNLWITVKGVSVDHSGFFDPGKDEGGPGYNRLSVKVSGDLIASNIRFDNPTQIRFWLNARNKPTGTYTIVITNPDGQVVTTAIKIVADAMKTVTATSVLQQKEIAEYTTGSSVTPNPTADNFTLQIQAAKEWKARVVLMDLAGKQLSVNTYSLGKGSNQFALSLNGYDKGTYLAAVYNQNNALIAIQKIIKQ